MGGPSTAHWVSRLPEGQIERVAGGPTTARGLQYHRRGHVDRIEWLDDDSLRGHLRIVDHTTSEVREFRTTVTPATDDSGTPSWNSTCTCRVKNHCAHAVGVLAGAREMLRGLPEEEDDDGSPEWERRLAPVTAAVVTRDEEAPQSPVVDQSGVKDALALEFTARSGAPVTMRVRRRTPDGIWTGQGANWTDLREPHRRLSEPQRLALVALDRANPVRQSRFDTPQASLSLESMGVEVWSLLQRIVASGVTLLMADGRDLVLADELIAAMHLDTTESSGLVLRPAAYRLGAADEDVEVPVPGIVRPVGDPTHGITVSDAGTVTMGPLVSELSPGARQLLLDPRPVRIPEGDRIRFFTTHLPALRRTMPVRTSDTVVVPEVEPPRLRMVATYREGHTTWIDWSWLYPAGDEVRVVSLADHGIPGFRQLEAEQRVLDRLARGPLGERPGLLPTIAGRPRLASPVSLVGMGAATFTEHCLPWLERCEDVDVVVHGEIPEYGPAIGDPVVHVALDERTEERDWFDLDVAITVDGENVPLSEVVRGLARGDERLLLASGTYFSLKTPALDRLRELVEESRALVDRETGKLRVSVYHVALFDQLASLGVIDRQAARFAERVGALRAALTPDAVASAAVVPSGLQAELRPYQAEGLRWASTLWDAKLGGILADDMGLGKTVQVIALLERARERGDLDGPVLVVAPTSVVGAWAEQLEQFAPQLRAVTVSETESRRLREGGDSLPALVADADVVLTSYTLLRLGEESYTDIAWRALILDEAQFVKNHRAKTYQVVRRMERDFTLAMTGTPLENSLMDLWSLLSLTAPMLYPLPQDFSVDFRTPIEVGGDRVRLAGLRRTITPFVLRRTKEAVASDLPPKQEQTLVVPMNPAHRRVYDRHLQRERMRVMGLLDDLPNNQVAVLSALTTLRQMALSPAMLDDQYAQIEPSKVEVVVEHLTELASGGHRALVFSQFTRYLKQVRDALEKAGIATEYLDGSTRDRQERLQRFRSGGTTAFCISLKAGGFGITLTEADYVYVLDPWWNPAAEAQAIDRTHRIGQERPVMVYRLVAADSIEEKVRDLQQRKRDLFARVVDDGEAFGSALTADDLRALLS
ncbi:DEAD/DEAH box helicase [Mobilicoccus pelagius]|uniref:Putative helicase n=1 Tax=Mobilicoccus pelagius NBRC 104925 TaxID=1089455 RepID=H5USM3_9MICO|nr:DEAD/DEAH box helicase [Mobilicoccus pelagius]GAB48731.1 putative helicase [Mobilicoccus pelagius NBRC 104925]